MRGFWAAIYLSLLDMRGDLRRFSLVLVCLVVGTALIAGVNSVGLSISQAVNRDAALLMGGDVEASRADRPANADELKFIKSLGKEAEAVDTNVGAQANGADAFVDLVAVGPTYPLLGKVSSPQLPADQSAFAFLAKQGDSFGALVSPAMLGQLGLAVGGTIELGGTPFQVRGVLGDIPDMNARGLRLGLPVMVSTDGLATVSDRTSPLPGLGTFFRYKVLLEGRTAEQGRSDLTAGLPGGGWSVRTAADGLGPMVRYYDLFMRFLIVTGLASLLIGGVSVGTGISSYVAERTGIIAVFRSIGAGRGRILLHFFTQVATVAIAGIGLGVLVGSLITLLILPTVGAAIGVELAPAVHVQPLAVAAGIGLLVVFAFSYLPLQRVQFISPATLFRAGGVVPAGFDWRTLSSLPQVLPLILSAAALLWLANVMVGDPRLIGIFALACVISAALFVGAVALAQLLLARMREPENRILRQALWAISGARAMTSSVIVAVGMTLAMLVVVLVLQVNLRNEFLGASVFDAPTLVATDLFQDELDKLVAMKTDHPAISQVTATPMLRGSLTAINGKPVTSAETKGPEASFLLSGDVPLTYRTEMPSTSKLVEGAWWPADYQGPPLVSLHQSLRTGLGVAVGDEITFTIFDEQITAKIANFRDYAWQGGIEFLATFSPGAISGFPVTLFTTVTATPGNEDAVGEEIAAALPDVRFIAIGKTLGQITTALSQLTLASALVGGLAAGNGLLVVIGSLAAGRRQRDIEAVIKTVIGERRMEVTATTLVQYLILALIAAVLATPLGVLLAWVLSQMLVDVGFSFDALTLLYVNIGAVAVLALIGAAATYKVVSGRPARFLREVAGA